ncbi:MAG: hypothetical protein WCJ62_08615, partial [Flavobacterium sp.]
MAKILGLDLGTNSIGWAIRDTNKEGNQIVDANVTVFPQGVGEEKGVEFSLASERTKHRASRKLYRRIKKRKTDLLKILIENGFCPLTNDELIIWSVYEKGRDIKYPTDNFEFSEWLKINPYKVRSKAVDKVVSKQELGRALYHMCKAITAQYLAAYAALEERKFQQEIRTNLANEATILKSWTEKGFYRQTDYLSLLVEISTLDRNIGDLDLQYRKEFWNLNLLCGMGDTLACDLKLPVIRDTLAQPVE